MIKTNTKHTGYQQAYAVQQRRVNAGKCGYAKAVRRFLKRRYERPSDYPAIPVSWSPGIQVIWRPEV